MRTESRTYSPFSKSGLGLFGFNFVCCSYTWPQKPTVNKNGETDTVKGHAGADHLVVAVHAVFVIWLDKDAMWVFTDTLEKLGRE